MAKPKVTLVTHTKDPLETVYVVWEASKNENKLLSVEEVKRDVDPEKVRELFRAVVAQRIPIGEHVDFVFMIEGVSVSWREQAVRHRIGVSPSPERLGVDMGMVDVKAIPDLADSSWWSQSMRIQDMGRFAERKQYRLPETVRDHADQTLRMKYHDTMDMIQDVYNELVKAGVPMEDARELIPLGATHRISWRLNIGALQHIVSKRGCWILQLGIWGPVIEGMISELTTKVDPIFGELVTPPCLKGDDFTGCVYMEENRRRYTQDDRHAPCPLHVVNHHLTDEGKQRLTSATTDVTRIEALEASGVPMAEELLKRGGAYKKFWGRDVFSGRRLKVIA
jgi:thymidylate synthase (FAD)